MRKLYEAPQRTTNTLIFCLLLGIWVKRDLFGEKSGYLMMTNPLRQVNAMYSYSVEPKNYQDDLNVTVLMLSKDKSRYIKTASASVLESFHTKLILIEPGSADNSRLICEQIVSEHPDQVTLISRSDSSPAQGLNHGLEIASNEILGVLNADDVYFPGALDRVRFFFKINPQIDLLLGAGFLFNETNGHWRFVLPSRINDINLYFSNYGSLTFFHQGMFYRRDRFPDLRFNSNNHINWDKEFLLSLVDARAKIGYLNNPLALFRLNETSITSKGFNVNQIAESRNINVKPSKVIKLINPHLAGSFIRIIKWLKLLFHLCSVHFNSFKMSIEEFDPEK